MYIIISNLFNQFVHLFFKILNLFLTPPPNVTLIVLSILCPHIKNSFFSTDKNVTTTDLVNNQTLTSLCMFHNCLNVTINVLYSMSQFVNLVEWPNKQTRKFVSNYDVVTYGQQKYSQTICVSIECMSLSMTLMVNLLLHLTVVSKCTQAREYACHAHGVVENEVIQKHVI